MFGAPGATLHMLDHPTLMQATPRQSHASVSGSSCSNWWDTPGKPSSARDASGARTDHGPTVASRAVYNLMPSVEVSDTEGEGMASTGRQHVRIKAKNDKLIEKPVLLEPSVK